MLIMGAVVIGRNEGANLEHCFSSILDADPQTCIVYVDSGSTDHSLEVAHEFNVNIVQLDSNIPFTAGRARNVGFTRLLAVQKDLDIVQFIDGDCRLLSGWLDAARRSLQQNENIAVVCGRRREQFPTKSIYNNLCEIEWNTPIGFALACGGDFICRVAPFNEVAGFTDGLIAGEEPELCYRLRQLGWKIQRVDCDMSLHDANILTVAQWAKRAERAGHAYAGGVYMHGRSKERFYVKEVLSILFWGLALPCIVVSTSLFISPLFASLLLFYVLKIVQIFVRHKNILSCLLALQYSVSVMAAKFFQARGVCTFYFRQLFDLGKQSLIEYK